MFLLEDRHSSTCCQGDVVRTCGGNNGFYVGMLGEGFHALFSGHVEDDALLDQVVHLTKPWIIIVFIIITIQSKLERDKEKECTRSHIES